MKNKILISASHYDTMCKKAWRLFEKSGYEVLYDPQKEFPSYDTTEIEALPDKEEIVAAVIGMDDYRDEKKYQLMPNLKAVAKFGVGTDNIDGVLAGKYGVAALNAPGQNSNAVAELTICFIIGLLRNVVPLHEKMREGKWPRMIGNELKGKTVGLLGFGAIARLVAEKLKAFDVRILAYDVFPDEEKAKELSVTLTVLEEVIEKSDIVSIHIPSTPDTYHFFDRKKLASMKKGAYLINPARGALVDLDALSDALESGHLAGAALDAFELEPLPKEKSIWKCENIMLTPHTGAETEEAYENVSMTTAEDILCVLNGEKPSHCVNANHLKLSM